MLGPASQENYRGKIIAFEGPDGSGKTTQFREALKELGEVYAVAEFREPGGTPIGEEVRRILLDPRFNEMCLRTELLLYQASRAQLVEQKIKPALKEGKLVIMDRFYDSTEAYQGAGGDMPREEILTGIKIATGGLEADLTLMYDVDADTAAGRLNPLLDRMEAKGREFHTRVREGYLAIAKREPHRVKLIDATKSQEEVYKATKHTIDAWLTTNGYDKTLRPADA